MISVNYGRMAVMDIDENGILYIASTSVSNNNNIPSNSGEEDVFVMAVDTLGNIIWTKMLAGTSFERVHRVKARPGGGCIVVCNSSSTNGSFSQNHSSYYDAGIFVYNSLGTLLWSKMYGGENDDYLYDIIFTSDGYWTLCGETYSNGGDLSGTGAGMNWVIKINPNNNGSIVWSKTFLGPDSSSPDWLENVYRLTQLSNGNIILTGYTSPNYQDPSLDRISIISITPSGNLNWTKKIGAPGNSDYPGAIVDNGINSFYIFGKLQGTVGGGGDAANYYGGNGDAWIIKLDYNGNIIWEKNLGGSNLDMGFDMKINSEGYLYLAGMTRSTNYEATLPGYGMLDFWLIKMNQQGDTLYTKKFGGSANDFATNIVLTPEGDKIFLIGGTESNDGNVSGLFGGRDVWLIRLDYTSDLNPNYGIRDDGGTNLPEITYWYTGQSTDITEKAFELDQNNLGTIEALYIKGSSVKTWKSGDGDVTGAQFNFKVWKDNETEPAQYTLRNIGWSSDDGDGNQTWANFGDEIQITSGLTAGTYYIKILYTITGTGVPGILQNGPFSAIFNLDISEPTPNYGMRDDGGVNLPEITYWYTGQPTDITEKTFEFDQNNLGTIEALYIKGSTVKTWKSGDGDVTGAQFNYKVWKDNEIEPAQYTVRNIGWSSDDGDGNQTWANFGDQIQITSGLTAGTYNIKILYTITGTGAPGILQNGPFTATFNILDPSGINSENQIFALNIYPNPFNEFINVESTEKINIKIFDFTGKLVLETELNNDDIIYLNELSSGIYFLNVENKNINQKIIKL